jgi:septum site-determining protein MinC
MTGESVAIKGTSEGLVIALGDGPLGDVLNEMRARLETKASFFLGGRVALLVGDRALSGEQLAEIGMLLQGVGVTLWAVESSHPETRVAASELGLETQVRPVLAGNEGREQVALQKSGQATVDETQSVVLHRTLRSGQATRHAGHITLIGDVNPGAEVVAGGDVIVWGKLRGTVHAGAMGHEGSVVCALQFAPSQIRIGSLVARPPDLGQLPTVPEVARVHEGQIIVERWDAQSRRTLQVGSWRLDVGGWNQRLRRLVNRS